MRSAISHILITIILAAAAVHAQSPKHSLYIASCEAAQECKEQTIRRFVFQDGKLTAEEIVASFPRSAGYFDSDTARVLENRYLVSRTGAVYDLQDKKLFAESLGLFAAYRDGKVYITEVNFYAGNLKTYAVELATRKVKTHSASTLYTVGVGPINPDGTRMAFFRTGGQLVFLLNRAKNIENYGSEHAKGSFKMSCGSCKDVLPFHPGLWLDNDRFITQRKNGEIVVYDFRTRIWTDIVSIPLPKDLPKMPALYRDDEGSILYRADQVYKIDVENKSHSIGELYGLGFGLRRRGEADLKQFSYEGKTIGTFISSDSKAIDGYLAAEHQDEPMRDSPPLGVRVWSRETRTWTTLKIAHKANLIGWVTEP